MHAILRIARTAAFVLVSASLAACGETGSGPTPVVASVSLASITGDIVPGSTVSIAATALDAQGSPVQGAPISFASNDNSIATVSSSGVLTAVAAGSTTISASSGGKTATTEVTVKAGGVIRATGGTVSLPGGAGALTIPQAALSSETKVVVVPTTDPTDNEHAVSGTAFEFGPDGTQFSQPVTLEIKYDAAKLPQGAPRGALRIAKLINGKWALVPEGQEVDSISGKVKALIRSFSSYAIVRDPCFLDQLGTSLTIGVTLTGRISVNDCFYANASRFSDYYQGELIQPQRMVEISSSGTLDGLFGVKDATTDPSAGVVRGSVEIGKKMRVLGSGPVQIFVSGREAGSYGSYQLEAKLLSGIEPSCGTPSYFLLGGGATISGNVGLSSTNTCKVAVVASPEPNAIGKTIFTHYYTAKFEAGKTYTVKLNLLGPSLSLAIFREGGIVALSAPDGTQVTSRTLTVTPQTTGYYTIEVGSGEFVGNPAAGAWVNPTGVYSISVSSQ